MKPANPLSGIWSASIEPLVLAAVALLGFSCVMTQLALLRECLSAFSGNEMVLGMGLGLWLLLMGIGAGLGRYPAWPANPLRTFAVMEAIVAILPLAQILLLRGFRNFVFVRGALVGVSELVLAIWLLLLPYCVVAGYALTLACSILVPRQGPAASGHVYVADTLGSIVGGMLFSFVFCRFFDHFAILVFPAALNLLGASAIALRIRQQKAAVAGLGLSGALGAIAVLLDIDGRSTAWQYAPQRIVAKVNSPYGKMVVTEDSGQYNLLENGVPLSCTRDDPHLEETVHFAMVQRQQARKVLLIGGGFSGTTREILKYNVNQVDYVELDPALFTLGDKYLAHHLSDPRVQVHSTDARLFVRQVRENYDLVILDVPAPETAQLNRFYTAEFFHEIHQRLTGEGVVSLALGEYQNFASPDLARILSSARLTLAAAFRNVLMLPGSRVFFLASDGPLFSNVAQRLEEQQVPTRMVQKHYLEAMFTPDRLADLDRAASRRAALNRDFSPMLYLYHLRHWLSQFDFKFGLAEGALLFLPALFFVRLRGCEVALLASGFAASALELVLLLGFQVICGSVYHQVGVIVTLFMAGLALGAWVANPNRSWAVVRRASLSSPQGSLPNSRGPVLQTSADASRRTLALLALGIVLYAVALPILLPLLSRLGATTTALGLTKALIALLALGLAVLVGMQFPVANRLEFDGTGMTASRLYTADFLGAFVGALLASTLLIPLMGVTGTCWLTAGVNLLAGAMVFFRK